MNSIRGKKKKSRHLLKNSKADFIQGTTVKGFCTRGENLTVNRVRTSGVLKPRSRVEVSGWKITERKHDG